MCGSGFGLGSGSVSGLGADKYGPLMQACRACCQLVAVPCQPCSPQSSDELFPLWPQACREHNTTLLLSLVGTFQCLPKSHVMAALVEMTGKLSDVKPHARRSSCPYSVADTPDVD